MNCYTQSRIYRLRNWSAKWLQLVAAMTILFGCQLQTRVLAQQSGAFVDGAVLLKNDRVLQGNVERRGDLFVVKIANQSAVSLPKDQVQYVGRSIIDLYTYKLRSIPSWTVGDHFKLTRWCMVNGLLDEAALHYREVAKQAGTHPRVKQLAIELKNHMLDVPEFRSFLGMAPISSPRHPNASSPEQALTNSSATTPDVVTASTMRVVQHPQVVHQFSERVQPILINRCSQSACHGGQSSNQLRLIEPYANSSLETSAKNLGSVLEQITESSESVSPLLSYATRAHGLQRKPGISVTETELVSELRSWIGFVQNPVVSAEGTSKPNANGLRQVGTFQPNQQQASNLTPVQPGGASLKQVPRPADTLPAVSGFPAGETVPTASELDTLESQINDLIGKPRSNDPFDPHEFNRQAQESR